MQAANEILEGDFMQKRFRLIASLAALSAVVASSQALLVDPTGSTFIVAGDDSTANWALGGTFTFYGNPFTTFGACTNGFLTDNGASSFSNVALPTTTHALIDPFWDDLWSNSSQTVFGVFGKNGAAGGNDAITWDEQTFNDQATAHVKFQALLVRNNQNIAGFNFLAGDIAFSYDVMSGGTSTLTGTIGVNNGNGIAATVAPGTANGTESGSGVPIFTNGGHFFLFRPDGQGGYTGSNQVVPEPASLSFLALGGLALLRRRKKA